MLLSNPAMWLRGAATGLMLLALAACGNAPAADVASPAPSDTTGAKREAPQPVEHDRTSLCASLREPLAAALSADVSLTATRFRDLAADVEREGCVLAAKGDGTHFADFLTVSQQAATMLQDQGWSEPTPLADGPTGTVLGFTRGAEVAQLTVGWQPAPDASCPIDQPITACQLAPEQKRFAIQLELASADSTVALPDAEVLKQTVFTYVMENTEQRNFAIEDVRLDGDVARAVVAAPGADAATVYAKLAGSQWTVVGFGTGFDPEFYDKHGIAPDLWLGQP